VPHDSSRRWSQANFLERKVEELQEAVRLAKKAGLVGDTEARWATDRAASAEAESRVLNERLARLGGLLITQGEDLDMLIKAKGGKF